MIVKRKRRQRSTEKKDYVIVMVNHKCQLHWARDAQIAYKTLFLGVSVRIFLEEISIQISRLSKEDSSSPVWKGIIKSVEGLNRTKMWRKGEFILFSGAGAFIFSYPQMSELLNSLSPLFLRPSASEWELHLLLPWFSGLQTKPELHHWPSWFSSLQMADHWTSQSP